MLSVMSLCSVLTTLLVAPTVLSHPITPSKIVYPSTQTNTTLSLGWVGLQPHLAQVESGVGGAAASPGPVRVWGGWRCSLTWPSSSLGWVGLQPPLAQLESGVGGAAASPGPVRVWGGWGYEPVVHWLISAPQVKSATSTHTHGALACYEGYHPCCPHHVMSRLHSCHVVNLCNKPDFSTPSPACLLGGAPKQSHASGIVALNSAP